MQDYAGHVEAVESDLEYFRTKRLEPRIFLLARRGVVTLYDLLRTNADAPPPDVQPSPSAPRAEGLEQRIRALEDRLDEFITGIAVTTTGIRGARVVIDDTRKERGDYDSFFKIAKRRHGGDLEERVERLEREMDECLLLLEVFTRALVATGEVTEEQLEQERNDRRRLGYRNGARLVARAWADPKFKRRLVETGRAAVRELDMPPGRLGRLGVAVNTASVHNVVVCTLCSCYPHDLLGDPPWWYRTDAYKKRIVEDPRATLADMFDLRLPEHVVVQVHDSTSDVRWMVMPRRPAGTEAMSEEQLARLVTPESLVGTAPALDSSVLAGGDGDA